MNKYNKYKIILALVITTTIIFIVHLQLRPKLTGTVIILNGPSCAGKSSIQKEFQYLMMPNLWIKLGIDNLFDKPMPDMNMENLAYWQSPNLIRWVQTSTNAQENTIITLLTGEQGEKVAFGMNSAIVAYAKEGNNIIVDYIAYKKEWVDDLRNKLKDINTYWVKVEIPLSALEEREMSRGTSSKGHARSHYDTVHWDIKYDFLVDSTHNSALTNAQSIKKFLQKKFKKPLN